jgi:hypothetical protein
MSFGQALPSMVAAQHPFAQADDQSAVLCDRNELGRRNSPRSGCVQRQSASTPITVSPLLLTIG